MINNQIQVYGEFYKIELGLFIHTEIKDKDIQIFTNNQSQKRTNHYGKRHLQLDNMMTGDNTIKIIFSRDVKLQSGLNEVYI